MFILIKQDLKQRLKSPLTWFIILVLCMMSILKVKEMNDKRLYRPFIGHDVYFFGSSLNLYKWSQFVDERYPKAYYTRNVIDETVESIIKANEENNVKEIARLKTFYHLIFAKSGFVRNDPIMNMVFKRKVIDMWNNVSNGIKYDDIDLYPDGIAGEDNYELLSAKYYYQLYKNDFIPIYYGDVNNITYLYDYFFDILPKFIIIVPIMLIYNIINKEKNTGSLKLILTQSISRRKYYISKWLSGVIYIIFILLFPPIIISTILGFTNGFVSMKYPTTYLKGTMTSFKPIPNLFDHFIQEYGINLKFNYSFIYDVPASKLFYPPTHRRLEVIPFYKYLLMVILLTILFIAFAVALIQLISAIINKEIISFIAVSGIFILGTLISSPFKYEKHLNLSPFTMENASRIVIGIYNVTALTSILILSLSTILLLIIGVRYFKKKEI